VVPDPVAHRRRRPTRRTRLTITVSVFAVVVVLIVVVVTHGSGGASHATTTRATVPPTTTTTSTTSPFHHVPAGPPTDQRTMSLIRTIGGPISPKSVDASDTGLVFAQNMMYRHSMTVYDSAGTLVRTIPDTVNLAALGVAGGSTVQGAPVEAAFTPDSRYVYVTNYSMYGPGQGPEGSDTCTPSSARAAGDTPSYVYRVDTRTLAVDQVIQVGLVPKYVAVTPNGKYVLVTDWCSWDLQIIDAASAKVVAVLPMNGSYPRGIAVSPDSSTAYVAIMGGDNVEKIDLDTLTVTSSFYVGSNPRHVVMDPAGQFIYVSLNSPGDVVKVALSTDTVVATTHTGEECRSLAISTDGRSLYVVNYQSDTISKLRASDMSVLQTIPTGVHPIGITYDATTGDVWVAVYTGQILVFADR
jgi:YVTN family beta-propeller protein